MTRASQCFGLLGLAWTLSIAATAQTVLPPQGQEFNPIGKMIGDQVHPQLALSPVGGLLVWDENTGTNGMQAVQAMSLGPDMMANGPIVPLGLGIAGDNENPQVALLSTGDRVVVWQGGTRGFQKVYARYLSSVSQFTTPLIQVNTYTNNEQVNPVVKVLKDGNVFVAWTSVGQDGDMAGVFARLLSPTGQFLGDEFQVNQTTDFNQRDPSVAVMDNGNVLVAWISEQQKRARSVDIFGRYFTPAGLPVNGEFQINDSTNICANPIVSAVPNGGFTVVWSQKDIGIETNGWDIYTRSFSKIGAPLNPSAIVNTYTYGDQVGPRIAASGTNQIVVWTSLLQDGDWEGIYGRILDNTGQMAGDEFRVNTTTFSRQIQPAVADSGAGQAVAVWTGFTMGFSSFDLYAQVFGSIATVVPHLTLVAQESQSWSLKWTTQPGATYQVQVSSNLDIWQPAGGARVAAGDTDSVILTPTNGSAYYRVLRLQ